MKSLARSSHRTVISTAAVVGALCLSALWATPAETDEIPGVGAPSSASDISPDGVVVGAMQIGEADVPFKADSTNGASALPLPSVENDDPRGPWTGSANLINGDGLVAGVIRRYDAGERGLVAAWDRSEQLIGTVSVGDESGARDLNEAGQVLVGGSSLQRQGNRDLTVVHSAVWTPTSDVGPVEIHGPGLRADLDSIESADLNVHGQVVGTVTDREVVEIDGVDEVEIRESYGFVWDTGGGMTPLRPAAGGRFVPRSINDSGLIVGQGIRDGRFFAAKWSGGDLVEIPGIGGSDSTALAVNEAGVIAGERTLTGGQRRAFAVDADGAVADVASLGSGQGTFRGLDESGTIVGDSKDAEGVERAFSWSSDTGTVPLTSDGVPSHTAAISNDHAVGVTNGWPSSQPIRASRWYVSGTERPEVPGAPRFVTAGAGDGAVTVAWARPHDNGGREIESYSVVAMSNGEEVARSTAGAGPASSSYVFEGLSNGVDYTFAVQANNSEGVGPGSQPVSATPQAGVPAPVAASGVASPLVSSAVTTGTSASVEQPVGTTVTVPGGTLGGQLSIAQSSIDQDAPEGFFFLGQQVNIEAPDATAMNPLRIEFFVHSSLLGDVPVNDLEIFRTEGSETVKLRPCDVGWVASPDPCVAERYSYGEGGVRFSILTSHASAWNFGVASTGTTFDFEGFYAPVDQLPTLNEVKAGRTIPIKFSLGGDQGLDVLAEGAPSSTSHACPGSARVDAVETTVAASGGTLSYDAVSNTYTYLWRTPKTFSGCRTFVLELTDGSEHTAEFQFR